MIRKPPFGSVFVGEWCLLQVVAGDGVVEKPRKIVDVGPILLSVKAPGDEPRSISPSEIAFVGSKRDCERAYHLDERLRRTIASLREATMESISAINEEPVV